jgi:hypothetical protein
MTAHPVFQGASTSAYQYLYCFGATKLNVQISNAAIVLGFGSGGGLDALWDPSDEPYLPLVGTLVRRFDAVRFKSLVAVAPAQLLLIPIT